MTVLVFLFIFLWGNHRNNCDIIAAAPRDRQREALVICVFFLYNAAVDYQPWLPLIFIIELGRSEPRRECLSRASVHACPPSSVPLSCVMWTESVKQPRSQMQGDRGRVAGVSQTGHSLLAGACCPSRDSCFCTDKNTVTPASWRSLWRTAGGAPTLPTSELECEALECRKTNAHPAVPTPPH